MIIRRRRYTSQEEHELAMQWRRAFAWFPVRVSSEEVVWMEYVEKRWDTYRAEYWARRIGDKGLGWKTVPCSDY